MQLEEKEPLTCTGKIWKTSCMKLLLNYSNCSKQSTITREINVARFTCISVDIRVYCKFMNHGFPYLSELDTGHYIKCRLDFKFYSKKKSQNSYNSRYCCYFVGQKKFLIKSLSAYVSLLISTSCANWVKIKAKVKAELLFISKHTADDVLTNSN